MIVDKVLGNIHDDPSLVDEGLSHEQVELDNLQLVKRVQRVTSDTGEEIGLRLPESTRELRNGDVLARDERRILTVRVAPTDVLVIAPTSVQQMGEVAHSLGNRHLQAQFFGPDSEYGKAVMVVAYDHTVEEFLAHVEVPFTREERVLPQAFRHAEHSH